LADEKEASALGGDQVLAYATTEGRALVTANIKDFGLMAC
jgi:hypothetical protein